MKLDKYALSPIGRDGIEHLIPKRQTKAGSPITSTGMEVVLPIDVDTWVFHPSHQKSADGRVSQQINLNAQGFYIQTHLATCRHLQNNYATKYVHILYL